jgi:lipopolysaccharide export system protein LptA
VRITIERLRTLVLVTGALILVALGGFLSIAHFRNKARINDVLRPLGANIQLDEKGVTYTQSHGPHTLFKIHASHVVQLKQDGRAQLHDVQIEVYGQDGSTVDRITGDEFDYDQKAGTASAAGPVEIFIKRPGVVPAVAHGAIPAAPAQGKAKNTPLASIEHRVEAGQIDVKTSGLTFNQKSGVASTSKRVEFATIQGQGSSAGATFDSANGTLVLDHAVELNLRHGKEAVQVHAQHAAIERDELSCDLTGADAEYRNGQAKAGQATILFRQDGSAVRMDARNGFTLTTATGAKVASSTGTLEFNERNQPRQGRMEGGVTMESVANGRRVQGAAPTAQLAFTPSGLLRAAHLERGVVMHSEEDQPGGARVTRDWRSPVADLDFRSTHAGRLELATVRGTGGVVLTGETQRAGGAAQPSRMAADQIGGDFSAGQELTRLVGVGHASMEQTSPSGVHQAISGDRLDAHFAAPAKSAGASRSGSAAQIDSAIIDGNVVLAQEPAQANEQQQAPMRAYAGHAVYEGAGELLHLTINPRVDNGELQLTADRIDVSQSSGDALALGNVKATWTDANAKPDAPAGQGSLALGGQGPAHIVASEAQIHKATGEATFRGHVRLWQQSNSIAAPVIVLDRTHQTLVARATGAAEPVNIVLLSAGAPGKRSGPPSKSSSSPSVVRVRAGDLKYSAAERKAVLHAGAVGAVEAETSSATTTSSEAEIVLLAPGNHAAPNGASAQVDRLIARGHVVVNSGGRRGTGEQLVYTSETGKYVLTGTAGAPPRMTDPAQGSVSGDALIFNSLDDSVRVEGQGQRALTQGMAPR